MIRVLTILAATLALAITAQPTTAGTSNTKATKLGKGGFVHPAGRRLSVRYAWRVPNPRRQSTAQLVQAQLSEAGLE
jgi:hypothetical protein